MLSRLVIAFLPGSKCLNFMAEVTIYSDFGVQENSLTISIVSPSICYEVMGPWTEEPGKLRSTGLLRVRHD